MSEQTARGIRGTKVFGGKRGLRKIGKVIHPVFHASEPRVVGFLVKRPDVLWMFKRADRFLALDAFDTVEGTFIVRADIEAWGAAACKRLGIDYGQSRLLEGMPLRTLEDDELGKIDDIVFDMQTGQILSVTLSGGLVSGALMGKKEIPRSYLLGYADDAVIIKPEAAELGFIGGAAAKAGEMTAKAKVAAGVAGAKAGESFDKGAYAFGAAIGKTKHALDDARDQRRAALVEKEAQTTAASGMSSVGAADAGAGAGADAGASAPDVSAANAPGAGATGAATTVDAATTPDVPDETTGAAAEGAFDDAAREAAARTHAASEQTTARDVVEDIAEKAGEGARVVGRQIDKTRGAFAAFRDEYKKSVSGED